MMDFSLVADQAIMINKHMLGSNNKQVGHSRQVVLDNQNEVADNTA